MKSSCGVNNYHIAASCLCGFESIINYRTRVGALSVFYDIYSCSLSPYLKLIYSSCTEGIGSGNKDFLALLLELMTKLADSCGLACTVYADDHYYRR